jgi:hypothetical protein
MNPASRVAKWHRFGHAAAVGVGMPLAVVYGMATPQPPNLFLGFALVVGFEILVGALFYLLNRKLFSSNG